MTGPAMRSRMAPYAILLAQGLGWGLTVPFAKIAVSTGYQPFGLIVWQLVIASAVLGTLMLVTGRRLPRGRAWIICLAIALVGSILPNIATYAAVRHLPAGVMAILVSSVPMFAFPMALALGIDRFSLVRLGGLLCGLAGVALIALPEASLPGPGMALWLLVALLAPVFYALESNIVAKWGTMGLDAIQLLFGASLIGIVFAVPLGLVSGQWIDPRPPWGAPEYALMASAAISSIVYASYVWLIGRTGSVFAAQVAYLVTGAGVLWSMALLGERFSPWVWAALALMLCGLALVQPRRAAEACQPAPAGEASAESI
jgi:drug/metabolite transporter (DMT)-like permease